MSSRVVKTETQAAGERGLAGSGVKLAIAAVAIIALFVLAYMPSQKQEVVATPAPPVNVTVLPVTRRAEAARHVRPAGRRRAQPDRYDRRGGCRTDRMDRSPRGGDRQGRRSAHAAQHGSAAGRVREQPGAGQERPDGVRASAGPCQGRRRSEPGVGSGCDATDHQPGKTRGSPRPPAEDADRRPHRRDPQPPARRAGRVRAGRHLGGRHRPDGHRQSGRQRPGAGYRLLLLGQTVEVLADIRGQSAVVRRERSRSSAAWRTNEPVPHEWRSRSPTTTACCAAARSSGPA